MKMDKNVSASGGEAPWPSSGALPLDPADREYLRNGSRYPKFEN